LKKRSVANGARKNKGGKRLRRRSRRRRRRRKRRRLCWMDTLEYMENLDYI
jgi:hypothetical protein